MLNARDPEVLAEGGASAGGGGGGGGGAMLQIEERLSSRLRRTGNEKKYTKQPTHMITRIKN